MIASMFNLDHRLAELRPSDREQARSRELSAATSTARTAVGRVAVPTSSSPRIGKPARSDRPASRLAVG